MFIEEIIDAKNTYKTVKIDEIDNEVQVRELTRKESKEYGNILYAGIDSKINLQNIRNDEKDTEIPITADILQFQANQATSDEYLIKTCFQIKSKDDDTYLAINDDMLDKFDDIMVKNFIKAYNDEFSVEKVKNFPKSTGK